jgi:pyrroline-5-carboxylate reductase
MELGIIGGGVMGEAILSRLLNQGIYPADAVAVSDRQSERCSYLRANYGVHTFQENSEIANSRILLLAVKPQSAQQVFRELSDRQTQVTAELVISIMAGISLEQLAQFLPHQAIARVMPNTPARVGAGVSAIATNSLVTAEQKAQVKRIFGCVGAVVEVPELLLDAVTGLSGSGPAYVALMIEALADGGVRMGLTRDIAQQLAVQTVLGTAQLIKETGMHPAQLKDQTASAGGTTIAGLAILEKYALRSALIEAVTAATQRSRELRS